MVGGGGGGERGGGGGGGGGERGKSSTHHIPQIPQRNHAHPLPIRQPDPLLPHTAPPLLLLPVRPAPPMRPLLHKVPQVPHRGPRVHAHLPLHALLHAARDPPRHHLGGRERRPVLQRVEIRERHERLEARVRALRERGAQKGVGAPGLGGRDGDEGAPGSAGAEEGRGDVERVRLGEARDGGVRVHVGGGGGEEERGDVAAMGDCSVLEMALLRGRGGGGGAHRSRYTSRVSGRRCRSPCSHLHAWRSRRRSWRTRSRPRSGARFSTTCCACVVFWDIFWGYILGIYSQRSATQPWPWPAHPDGNWD